MATKLGIIVPPRIDLYDQVRGSSRTRFGRFKDNLRRLALVGSANVRGDVVAVDTMIEAFISAGSLDQYVLITHPNYQHGLSGRVQRYGVRNQKPVLVRSLESRAISDLHVTALLAPNIDGTFFYLRDSIKARLHPLMCLSHGFSLRSMLYSGFLKTLFANSYPFDSIICTSNASKKAMQATFEIVRDRFNREFSADLAFSGRFDVLPLCVDVDKFEPRDPISCRKKLGLPVSPLILLYFGRISPLKADLFPLVTALNAVRANGRDVLLIIAGTQDGDYGRLLEEYAKEIGIQKSIKLIYNVSDVDKPLLMSSADIFLAPSDTVGESFGISVVEAMASGIPQIAADWSGYRDTVLHNETGMLVRTLWTPCDKDLLETDLRDDWEYDHLRLGQSVALDLGQLIQSIQALVENEPMRRMMAIKSRERAKSLFSFSRVIYQYEGLAKELSEMADSSMLPAKAHFHCERPEYFFCFKGHASEVIDQETARLHVRDMWGGSLWLLRGGLAGTDGIILREIQMFFEQSSGGRHQLHCTGIHFSDVIEYVCSKQVVSPEVVARNLMWLIKQGFLEVQY